MRDFTLNKYSQLLTALTAAGFDFVTFAEFVQAENENRKTIILRHDVDKYPLRALETAELENRMGIRGTYYFRVRKRILLDVIQKIASMGHEIGYHYEDLDTSRGNVGNALQSFEKNLESLRKIAAIKTICMHGSPYSRYDNRDLWKTCQYSAFGLIGEPYFDIDFSRVLYLTDTGRSWNGSRSSIRDRIELSNSIHRQFAFRRTNDIIHAVASGKFPAKAMITTHPQRWSNNSIIWSSELIWQNVKNVVKIFRVITCSLRK